MLEIKELYVSAGEKVIIKGISLTVPPGKIIALMGPNGSGKSTLSNSIMGNPKYRITSGIIELDGEDITNIPPNERSAKGLFLSFQNPVEVDGVTIPHFLRTALAAKLGKPVDVIDFKKLLDEKMELLKIDSNFLSRYLNKGFSGGEKKKAEVLQLAILQPKYAILDETDSGTDVDALRTIAEGINKVRGEMGILLITHYDRILQYLKPDLVLVIKDGTIVKQGPAELAKEIEISGYLER